MRQDEAQGAGTTFADFVAGTMWADVAAHGHEAKRSILNFFATALGSAHDPAVSAALRTLLPFSGAATSGIIGRPERLDAMGAAFVNAISANLLDFDDTHLDTIIHPAAPVAAPVLALAQARGFSGQAVLTAFVLGVEVECRVGNAVSPGHYARGWHITSTCGVFGAAAACAKLLGLSVDQISNAIGIAASQSAGIVENLPSAAKNVSVGNAARNGLFSALLAEKGFSGPAEPIAGAQGFLAAMGEPPNWAALTEGLGKSWEVNDNSLKPYPAGFVIHPLLDCALDWRRQHPGAVVERVAVRGNPLLLQRTDRPEVASGRESQVSLQHAVAAALVLGKAGLDQFTDACVDDPVVKEMRRKVEVASDPAISTIAVEMDFWTKDGKKHSVSTQAARGSSANPLKDSEVEQKLLDEARSWRPAHDIKPLIDAVWALDKSGDVSNLAAMTVPR